MDGNGRWAEQRGLKRSIGHRAGARAVSRTVEAAARHGVDVLTLYAFSSDNWSRPAAEVAQLMDLFRRKLQSEVSRCIEHGVRVNVIGRRDRLDAALRAGIERVETRTRDGNRMLLRLAIDYSARDALARAARTPIPASGTEPEPQAEFARCIERVMHALPGTADVDLLIRTGGERRLSDFLLFESAYAELLFLDQPWPDFDAAAFEQALREFAQRERRYGGLTSDRGQCKLAEQLPVRRAPRELAQTAAAARLGQSARRFR
jgi:undecaprenyl diphosphate synthase